MKLLSFEDFMKHARFQDNRGLCSNLSSIYGYQYRYRFEKMCEQLGLCSVYPIGVGSFNKPHKDESGYYRSSAKSAGINSKNSKQYNRQCYNKRMYKGIPLVLRERLYNAFIAHIEGIPDNEIFLFY